MQQFFPLLHGLVQECKWRSIPTEWQELLAELARRAARVITAAEVSNTVKLAATLAVHAMCVQSLLICRFLIMLLLLGMMISTASCQHIQFVAAYRHLRQTRVEPEMSSKVVQSILASMRPGRLVS